MTFGRRPSMGWLRTGPQTVSSELSVYTILLSLILHGVWHTQGSSRGGLILRNSRAIVWEIQVGGRNERTIDSCTNDPR